MAQNFDPRAGAMKKIGMKIKNKHDLDIDEENAKFAFGKTEEDLTSQLKIAKEDTDEKTATKRRQTIDT